MRILRISIIILLILGCASKDATIDALLESAGSYIKADEKIIQGGKDFLADYDARNKIEINIIKSPMPNIKILENLLKSEDSLVRKKALVITMIKKVADEKLLEIIIDKYKPSDDYFTKFYGQHCMLNAKNEQIFNLSKKILNVYESETNEAIIIIGMPNLIRLDADVSIPFFVKYFKTGSLELRRAAYVYLKKADGKILKGVIDKLKEDKSHDALKVIDEFESGKM